MSRLSRIPLRARITALMAVLALLAASSYAALGADTAVDSAQATGRAGGPGQGHGVHQFIGSWRLVSFEARTADGQVIYPFGRDADGVLTYTRDRRMSATLWKAGRQPFAINDQQRGTPEENTAAIRSYVHYLGTFKVDRSAEIVHHHLEQSVFPNWNGTTQTRFYAFSDHGDRLELTTPPVQFGGTTLVASVSWRRM